MSSKLPSKLFPTSSLQKNQNPSAQNNRNKDSLSKLSWKHIRTKKNTSRGVKHKNRKIKRKRLQKKTKFKDKNKSAQKTTSRIPPQNRIKFPSMRPSPCNAISAQKRSGVCLVCKCTRLPSTALNKRILMLRHKCKMRPKLTKKVKALCKRLIARRCVTLIQE